ncbi:Arginine repressor [bioreactor metagenome]|jgi:transcriptional regulator of arginine metabolism|uniref:Arginine repressor n=1 Tax=bioreactor metagenome TaxID=1076179 RepID=A0A644V1I1_9ZZZZ|nr:ArgR family transcriptional regulator [Paludibacter sp.]
MKNKRNRLQIITELLRSTVVGSQEELLTLLAERKLNVTQATLSRDLKLLKVAKTPLANGTYKYVLPPITKTISPQGTFNHLTSHGAVLSIEFSGHLAVMKTKPGYASAIAWDIDNKGSVEILGTIAGDDTILIIPREGVTREQILTLMDITFSEGK